MMKSNKSGVAKRQRIAPMPGATFKSADLWCGIAEFLPMTSRALLAVALTAPSASFRESGWKGQPNAVSKAIISVAKDGGVFDTVLDEWCEEDDEDECKLRECLSEQLKEYYHCHQWEVMDFVDLPLSLASRLTDDDIAAILVCIDAKNKLKRLKLTHCFKVVGHGLEPLRSSTVLEKLDLGIAVQFAPRFEKAYWLLGPEDKGWYRDVYEIQLSEGPIVDILHGILREEGNTFRRLQYPFKWYDNDNSSESDGIARVYDYQIERSERMKQFVKEHGAIVNKFSCCIYFGFADERAFCRSFEEDGYKDLTNRCLGCVDTAFSCCSHCSEVECYNCSYSFDIKECIDCNARYCARCCRDNGFADEVTWCEAEWCGASYCRGCRLSSCKSGTTTCEYCRSMAFTALLEECNLKQVQIDAQRDEIARLRQG